MKLTVRKTSLPEVLILEPAVHGDARGFFFESFNARNFQEATNVDANFVQDNHSKSRKGVLRGLHYQVRCPQGKLVRVTQGSVFDVAVDIRRSSVNFGKWFGVELSADNMRQLWIPPGFAHGFLVTTESADVLYKTTDYWQPGFERCLMWNDPAISIAWPDIGNVSLAAKDLAAPLLVNAEIFD